MHLNRLSYDDMITMRNWMQFQNFGKSHIAQNSKEWSSMVSSVHIWVCVNFPKMKCIQNNSIKFKFLIVFCKNSEAEIFKIRFSIVELNENPKFLWKTGSKLNSSVTNN